jgi:kynurenine 3-monooxygenase
VVLDDCLSEFGNDRKCAFAEYFIRRKKNTDALAQLALENFVEMRDKTGSRLFRAKKKIDHLLEAALPHVYLPLYSMVTFTRIPYEEAARRAHRQDRIVCLAFIAISLMLVTLAVLALS